MLIPRDDSLRMYSQLLSVREEQNAQKRGYRFEQIAREILPWDHRPPISVVAAHEQLDAFFEWNSWHFLVEAKAKASPILPGSHDWEDFNLKVANRRGQCIGLFLSLFEVSPSLYESAGFLNKTGCATIIIAGKTWDELARHGLPLSNYIRYMLSLARSTFSASPPRIPDVLSYCYEITATSKRIAAFCTSISSTFLRRYKLTTHESIYVHRPVDRQIAEHIRLLKPHTLRSSKTRTRRSRESDREIETKRARPKQIMLLRDFSGSGKTTLAVQIALETESYFGIGRAALQPDVDDFANSLSKLGDDLGLQALHAVDKPLVYVVDSLDEAKFNAHKKREILALLRCLDELNERASEQGFLAFPVCLIFTVREDYWRDWESTFEGVPLVLVARRFSYFSTVELDLALEKYSSAYGYFLNGNPDPKIQRILSHPFSLLVFSEANKYRGEIDLADILDANVMTLYFESKKEDLLKRPIPGFDGKLFMRISSCIAARMASMNSIVIDRSTLFKVVEEAAPTIAAHANDIVSSLISEQILIRDAENFDRYRVRHARFLEYLVAYYIASELIRTSDGTTLENLGKQLLGGIASFFRVHEFIRHICSTEAPEVYADLTRYFSSSKDYLENLLRKQRSEIALGGKTSALDLDTAIAGARHNDPEIAWDTFFVVSARANRQPKHKVLDAFCQAIELNQDSGRSWKLIEKMTQLNLTLHEEVLRAVLLSPEPRCWYVLLDTVYNQNLLEIFRSVWESWGDEKMSKMLRSRKGEWRRVATLAEMLLSGSGYDPSKVN